MPEPHTQSQDDAARAVRYMAVKAAIFILIPMAVAAITVLMVL
jgi:hypothetical protein